MSNVREKYPDKPSRYVDAKVDLAGGKRCPIVILGVDWNDTWGKYELTFAHYHDGMDLAAPHLLRPAYADEQKTVEKLLTLNKTNSLEVARVYGDETDHWPGALLTIYCDQWPNPKGPGTVPGVRVEALPRPAQPRATPAELAALQVMAEPTELPGSLEEPPF